ncbi:MAG TPA: peptidoglycan recognition family protein, partial [Gaiellales bacterium]|nr:peptidoglycan recognition family protein [Gaiellales bacterium]
AVVVASTGPAGSHGDDRARTLAAAKRQLADRSRAQQRWYEARRAQLIREIHQARAARRATPENEGSSAGGLATISTAGQPKIVRRFIPFGAKRHAEMRAYVQRHYGLSSDRLTNPHALVEHYTGSAGAQSAINTFTADAPDVELHELPGVCSHFVIDTDGTIYQVVSLTQMCRHTVGLTYTSIGIEHAGFSDRQILNNPAQLQASLSLTRWLRCQLGIKVRNVIGHSESLTSPYHREDVASLRNQTHDDWSKADMDVYRGKLDKLGC